MREELSSIVNDAIDSYFDDIHTAIPGIIQTYDPTTKTVTVLPSIKLRSEPDMDSNNDDEIVQSMPIIVDVPVMFPGTADFVLQYPLKKGDKCLLIFSESSLEGWYNKDGEETDDGGDPRCYSLSDAFCIPGCFAPGSPGKVGTGSGFELLYKSASIKIDDSGNVSFNGIANQFVTWTALNTALQNLLTIMNAAVVGSPGSKVFATPLTLDISAAKTTTVKTA